MGPRWMGHDPRRGGIDEGRRMLFEIKLSSAPKPSRGFHQLRSDLDPVASWLVAPVGEP